MWEFYLAAGEVAFQLEDAVVFQIQICRNPGTLPITRNYIGEAERSCLEQQNALDAAQ
jgi:cyclopropane-fatty-acyl-phospholipid synthase